jgi:WD40 repeat protein
LRRFLLFLLLLPAGVSSYAETPERVVIQSGHTGAITKLIVTPDGKSLVSIGEDGTLRVWNKTSHTATQRIQVGPLPIVDLALHPTLPRAAVVESDGISIHRLSVWDWSENRRVFSRDLEALPLYLAFSPGGSFLAYSVADWQSMAVLDSRTGSRPSYLRNGFGIVSAFKVSSSEQRILAYLSSGSIQYRDLRSGSLVQEYKTLANIEQSRFMSSNKYMIGKWEDSLVAIDLLSGVDVASIRLENLMSFSIDEDTGAIICVIGPDAEENSESIQALTFTGSNFRSRYTRYAPPDGYSSNLIEASKTLYGGTHAGSIYYQTSLSSVQRLFAQNRLLPVDDFDASESLVISTAKTIVTLYADLLFGTESSTSDVVLTHTQPNPLNSPVSVHSFGNGSFALQDTGGFRSQYQLFSPVEGAIGLPNDRYSAPIISLDTKAQRILTVDAAGNIQIYNLLDSVFDFETHVFGVQEAVFVQGNSIVAAGRRSQEYRTSKLLIDTSTGETVPFNDTSLETYLLTYEPLSHTLYTLSLEATSTSRRTVLTSYSGTTFETEEVLFSIPGSYLDSSMHVSRGTLFLTTGGVNRALYPGSTRLMPVDGNENIPVKVEVIDKWLIGLNRDYSFTIWERATGKLVVNFYLFDDEEWVAITSSGKIAASAVNTSSYVRQFP